MGDELIIAPGVLPEAHDLIGLMRLRLESLVAEERARRGEVLAPEDTYEALRRLASLHEGLTGYARAFQTIAKEVLGYVQDDLESAVGEQDGIPVSGLDVPDPDGTTVRVHVDLTSQGYTFDLDALLTAVAAETLAWLDRSEDGEEVVDPPVILRHALDLLLTLGKFEPQVSKVRAFAQEVARHDPKAASTVTRGIRKRNPRFGGVKLERKQPKGAK